MIRQTRNINTVVTDDRHHYYNNNKSRQRIFDYKVKTKQKYLPTDGTKTSK